MKYFTVGPDNIYFEWMYEVMLTNFRKVGIDLHDSFIIVMSKTGQLSSGMLQLKKKFPEVNFSCYAYEKRSLDYLATLKPYGMYRFFLDHPDFSDPIFYHDSDFIFLKSPDFSALLEDDIWYLSDTVSYVGYEYLLQFGIRQIAQMAKISGISIETIRMNQRNSGGAQYIIKNSTTAYWGRVYEDSFLIRQLLRDNGTKVQVWCAEMWATIYAAWHFGYELKVDPLMDFVSSTDKKEKVKHQVMLHNNGVQPGTGLFYKGDFRYSKPFGRNLRAKEDYCSHWYLEAINEVK